MHIIRTKTELLIPDGFHLTVRSWENDGDNDQEHSKVYRTLAIARAAASVVESYATAFGNTFEDEFNDPCLVQYDYTSLEHYLHARLINEDEVERILTGIFENTDDDELLEEIMTKVNALVREDAMVLLGYSESYYCRVFAGHDIVYLQVPIQLGVI